MQYCPKCNSILKDGSNFCENCGNKFYNPQQTYTIPNKHSGLGIAALILGIISMCLIWTSFLYFLYLFIELPLSIIATILGGVAYWGKWKDKFGLAGFILGLLVVIIGLIFAILPILLYRPYY